MKNFLNKYFNNISTENNKINSPADLNKIIELENILSVKFPQDYKDFMMISNGYEGKIGKSYVRLLNIENINEYTKNYCGDFFPWLIYIGTDGGNEMYVIDKRKTKLQFGLTRIMHEIYFHFFKFL